MHMSDALVSLPVGVAFWALSAGAVAYASHKTTKESDRPETSAALMGVFGAFIFAAQMINFAIPGTGSSGHIGGGLLLAILLGPCASFMSICAVLTIQALFFADGGLLALGCNMFNLGIVPAFIIYPFVYKPLWGNRPGKTHQGAAILFSSILALVAGSFFVVLQTTASGISALPFQTFLSFMIPIHIAIGLVEGLITLGVVMMINRAGLPGYGSVPIEQETPRRRIFVFITAAALLIGGFVSWHASSDPDGLEWSVNKTVSSQLYVKSTQIHSFISTVQQSLSFLPDYSFSNPMAYKQNVQRERWGLSLSALSGSVIVIAGAFLLGLITRMVDRKSRRKTAEQT